MLAHVRVHLAIQFIIWLLMSGFTSLSNSVYGCACQGSRENKSDMLQCKLYVD